jgi:hypothetical protein
MKHVLFISVAGGLLLATGCTKKNEEGGTCPMGAEEGAVKTQESVVQAAEKAEAATEKMAEATENAARATRQATAAINTVAVKAEDVMGDLNQSVAEIKQKVSGFDQTQLLAYADQYKGVILEKKDQLVALGDKLKGLSMTELLGEKGKALKNQLAQYTDQLGALKERYEIYLGKLKEFGVDLSAYGL